VTALTVRFAVTNNLTPALFRSRVALRRARAWLDATSGTPAAIAWAQVMDALYICACAEVPNPPER
jgi:hypothetical protein